MTNPNPSGWADPTFGSATSNPAEPGQPPTPGQLPTPGPTPPPGQLPSIGNSPSVGQVPVSGEVYSPAAPAFGQASVPTPERSAGG